MKDIQRLAFNTVTLRERRGWTQARFSQICGIDQPNISDIENAKRPNLEIKTIMRIAEALGVQWQRLFDEPRNKT